MDFQRNDTTTTIAAAAADRYFLLNFIMSNYLGPDVYSDNPRCSASLRMSKCLPPYSIKNLGSSSISIAQLESLYYYVLKNAHSTLILKPNMLYKFFSGNLSFTSLSLPEGCCSQFTTYFPLNLHDHKKYPGDHEVVKGIVLIDDPDITCIKEEDLEKFKRLSGIEDLKIDKVVSLCYQHGYKNDEEKDERESDENDKGKNDYVSVSEEKCKRKWLEDDDQDPVQLAFPRSTPVLNQHVQESNHKSSGPFVLPLVTAPKIEGSLSDPSITLTGTAAMGIAGPPVGVLDIGMCETAYFFQVALPGVRRDYSEFSCEIEPDGKVHIRGFIIGGETIKKRSRVFHMKYQRLCPPGEFTLSFSLPGPVDPRLFSPNFRSDGILEGIVIKD
ncbi:hypothetical protein ACFE04_015438 [Oxalis oulophora]